MYAGHLRHRFDSAQVASHASAASTPHSTAGPLLASSPDRPASNDGGSSGIVPGGAVVDVTTGAGAAGPSNAATTMSRCRALKRGWHVVNVSRLSGVGSSTDTSRGRTIF